MSEIPERWRSQCPICKGAGSVERVGFANALHMDSGEPEKMIRISCHACHGRGWLMPAAEDVLAKLGTAESLVRDLAQALEGMRREYGRNRFCTDPYCAVCADQMSVTQEADAALSRIPKEMLPK